MKNNNILFKTLLLTLLISVTYAVYIDVRKPQLLSSPGQWSENRIKAENYIYSDEKPSTVIVGSSLAFRLGDTFLGKHGFNLAFAAGGALTGLELLSRSEQVPQRVLIETNFINKEIDQAFIDGLFLPGLYWLRKNILALREQYRPVSLVVSRARPIIKKFERQLSSGNKKPIEQQQTSLLQKMVDSRRKTYQRHPDEKTFRRNLTKMQRLISGLEKRGASVAFIQMPEHPSLMHTPFRTTTIENLQNAFPVYQYDWLVVDNNGEYKTTDGIHLTPNSARQVAELVKQRLIKGRKSDDAI